MINMLFHSVLILRCPRRHLEVGVLGAESGEPEGIASFKGNAISAKFRGFPRFLHIVRSSRLGSVVGMWELLPTGQQNP